MRQPAPAGRRDNTDYEHRHFVNLCATAFLLALGLCFAFTIRIFDDQQRLEKCLMSGRKDCVEIAHAPAAMIKLPERAPR
ncbi:MAG: hypothetical protein AB7F96_02510 [Beijerinckiaceae bacterium]